MIDDGKAIFQQIADYIADSIVDGTLAEQTRVPSTNELAAFYRINPATAAKGINLLVDQGVLYKQRGVGMFVADGARQTLRRRRREDFADRYVTPLLAEAARLGLSADDVVDLIRHRSPATAAAPAEGDLP
ncbi:MAG: GntR family transcriptional regulator [Gordonia sp. (in: high G+C Gram-positive bacteria)]|uniref:GntR family transcriptional regulator n=1 Tax=Gordonia TaxID=2053 RepID=UPI0032663BD9